MYELYVISCRYPLQIRIRKGTWKIQHEIRPSIIDSSAVVNEQKSILLRTIVKIDLKAGLETAGNIIIVLANMLCRLVV